MGKSGMVNGAYTKWKRKASVDRKWATRRSSDLVSVLSGDLEAVNEDYYIELYVNIFQ